MSIRVAYALRPCDDMSVGAARRSAYATVLTANS
jgi:hypothetical protein